MSPEQCRGRGEVDHRTDIYSLGCTLFEMLCGRPPFTDEGFGELIQSHLSAAPPTIRSLDPALLRPVEALVARMLAKSRDDRPQTMRDVIVELDALRASKPAPVGIGSTRILPSSASQLPMVQTTMRSASGERMAVPGTEKNARDSWNLASTERIPCTPLVCTQGTCTTYVIP